MMRILIATPWTGFWEVGARGGVPDEFLTIRELVRRAHEVHVAAPAGADYALPGEGPGSLDTHALPYPARRWRGRRLGQLGRLRDLALARRAYGGCLLRVARAVEPDLILAHTFHAAPWAARVGRRLGVPVVAKFFGVLELNSEWSPRWLHFLKHFEHYLAFRSPAARFIVLDDGTGGDQAARRLGVPADRLLFWPNGVDVEWGDETVAPGGGDRELRGRFGLPAAERLVLTLCNLLPLKRVERLLDAVAEVPEATAVVAGDGEMREALEARAAARGVSTIFLGAVDHARVPELMRAVDIYVAPHDLTNAGLPTCEAMLCGLPVVALDIGETRRLVADGETGIVVPPAAGALGLAAAIRRLVHDPAARQRMGARGRQVARERCVSWNTRVRMEMELLEELGGEPPLAAGRPLA